MVQKWKINEVKSISESISEYPVVGILDMNKLPAAQLQTIKKELRDIAEIKMTRKSILFRAIGESKKDGIGNLSEFDIKTPALILSKENPFKLLKKINKSKVSMFLKAGDISPKEIVIPEGDTKLAPGPIIGELQKAGIRAKIQGPIIKIMQNSTVAKVGDKISPSLAGILMQLGVKPLSIGLNLVAAYENGTIFTKETLDINESEYVSKIQAAYTGSFNLAFNSTYPTAIVMPYILGKASSNALNLAVNAGVVNSKTVPIFIQKATAQMTSVASRLPSDARGSIKIESAPAASEAKKADEKKEEPKEEKKPEEAAAGLSALFG